MKKKLTPILFFLISVFTISAKVQGQAALLVLLFGDKAASENFNFSILAGLNASNISNQPNSKSLTGINFGLGVNIKLSDKFYLKPEFKPVSPKGFQGQSSLNSGTEIDQHFNNVNTTRSLSYIDVPVLLSYQVFKHTQVAFGPQVSFLTKAKEQFEGTNDATYEQDIKGLLNKADYGLTAAVTYMLSGKRNGKGINVQLRYNAGLSDVYKNAGSNKTGVFSVNLEFPFISDAVAAKNLAPVN